MAGREQQAGLSLQRPHGAFKYPSARGRRHPDVLMSTVTPTSASAVQAAKRPARRVRRPAEGPTLSELILRATAAATTGCNGMSFTALKKALAAGGYDADGNCARIKTCVRILVEKGSLVSTKSRFMFCGSFKISKDAKKAIRKKVLETEPSPNAHREDAQDGDGTAAVKIEPEEGR